MAISRRSFLKASAYTLATTSLASMTTLLTSAKGHASEAGDYKALVCLFFYGGMDNHDTIIPYDDGSYQRWSEIRQSILSKQQMPRTRDNLLPLSPINSAQFGTRQFALPPELSGIHQLFQSGKAAIVGNVGPLIEPTTAESFSAEQVSLPARLFSHNDQQSTWMSGATEGAQFGWAGLYADKFSTGSNTFANITTGGAELLLTGKTTSPYIVSGGRALRIDIVEESEQPFKSYLANHFGADYFQGQHLLQQDIKNKISSSFSANNQYNLAINSSSSLQTEFPQTGLGRQLQAVAKSIAARDKLGSNRQVFAVGLGGFDTHSEQAKSLPELQQQINDGVVAFYNAMTALGLQDEVALFTAGDFGRTLATNGDGTDHGWGAHHFVIGGGVQGQQIFGDIPLADFGHEHDAGSGRLIPTQSVDQYASALGQWFGVEESELLNIFPNLVNFAKPPRLFG